MQNGGKRKAESSPGKTQKQSKEGEGSIKPEHPGFHVVRNVGGVGGLHIAYEVFSEEAEQRYYNMTSTHDPAVLPDRQRSGEGAYPCASQFPSGFWELLNACRDCGLQPELTEQDFCLVW